MKKTKEKGSDCRHDYKNATKVGKIDYLCPLCDKLIDPNEWFFMNHMESLGVKFVEVKSK